MANAIPPSFPMALDSNTAFSNYTTSTNNTTAYNGANATWVNPTILEKVQGYVSPTSVTTEVNPIISKITGSNQTTIDSSLFNTMYPINSLSLIHI